MDKDVITQDIEYHRNKKTLKLKTNKEITIDLDNLKSKSVLFKQNGKVFPYKFYLDEMSFDTGYNYDYQNILSLSFRECGIIDTK